MKITYSADAHVSPTDAEGYLWERGETKDVPDAVGRSLLTNQHFTDQDGRNAYSCSGCGTPVLSIAQHHPAGPFPLRREGEAPTCADCAGAPSPDPAPAAEPLRVPALREDDAAA